VSDSASVKISIGFDASALQRILTDAEARIMREHREQMLTDIRRQWTGWKYKGRNPASVGRSLAGWKASEQTTEGVREIVITNKARGYYTDKPYSAYVARKKGATPEWEVALQNLLESNLPAMQADLEAAIVDALTTEGPPKRVRENKSSTYKRISLEV
jgi:hypothetical protein